MTINRLFIRKPEGKRPIRRQRRRCEYNIKTNLTEQDGVVWTELVWLRIRKSGEVLRNR
jgi:hypothetical protein